ncbi:Ubiquitin-conjugating enzyme family member protein [Aphelenchoides avenae]|nr:Ubiquitin-conjugating enzyme family member protein [Aphelenchus avenae]
MSTVALKRLRKELATLRKEPVPLCDAGPINDNLFHWNATIHGPPNSPYEGGVFNLTIVFTNEYPMKPPTLKFNNKLYHPNIMENTGGICLDIIKPIGAVGCAWSPTLSISKVLISLVSLLTDPNPSSALNIEAAKLYCSNRQQYDAKVREYVQRYASASTSSGTQPAAPAA